MITDVLSSLIEGKDLSGKEAELVMNEIMEGKTTDAQIGAFLTALRLKGETVEEISAFAKIMREKASRINPKVEILADTCGTGGDCADTFNISTAVSFILAASGVAVAKHGNRSVSSQCGSADVLEALGVKVDLEPEKVKESIEKIGIGFMFAPAFHKAMKYAIGPRKEIGIRTVFNILGPLTNPAEAKYQLLGVYDDSIRRSMAEVLKKLGAVACMVVHGNGLDEVTTTGVTKISELKPDETIEDYEIKGQDFGLDQASINDIKAKDKDDNVKIIKEVLSGAQGPKTDIVLLNSACALKVAQQAQNIEEGLEKARDLINSKKPLEKLEELVKFSNA
ncbi:MAG: anthranilate phosphoribosyltransferase [Actinobacteria bacterium]|nr:MAG: anthranilate phosphoribosyltransferase [Actinomycetota bacterium]